MKFDGTVRLGHSVEDVVRLMIEQLEDLVLHMPSIHGVEVLGHQELDDGRVRIDRRWRGNASRAPKVVRPFATEQAMTWVEVALWDPALSRLEWALESESARFFECRGVTRYRPHPAAPTTATMMLLEGELTVVPERLPGMPPFLASRLAGQVERFAAEMLCPDVAVIAGAINAHFSQWSGDGADGEDVGPSEAEAEDEDEDGDEGHRDVAAAAQKTASVSDRDRVAALDADVAASAADGAA